MLVHVENRMVTSIQRSLVDRFWTSGCHSVQMTASEKKARLAASVTLPPETEGWRRQGRSSPPRAQRRSCVARRSRCAGGRGKGGGGSASQGTGHGRRRTGARAHGGAGARGQGWRPEVVALEVHDGHTCRRHRRFYRCAQPSNTLKSESHIIN